MAKVHKAHKSSSKYSFQKKHLSAQSWLIIIAVVAVAAVGLVLGYNSYVSGEVEVSAPAGEKMNNIAANWEKLAADGENFLNLSGYYGLADDGSTGMVSLMYLGNTSYSVEVQIMTTTQDLENTDVTATGSFTRTSLTDFINGVAPWGQKSTMLTASGANCAVYVGPAEPGADVPAAALEEVVAELEALALAAPELPESKDAPAEDAAPAGEADEAADSTAEEAPAADESAEPAGE